MSSESVGSKVTEAMRAELNDAQVDLIRRGAEGKIKDENTIVLLEILTVLLRLEQRLAARDGRCT